MSSNSLSSGLKVRHLTMMGLGSTIGAGLFLGTGVGIQAAGPAVLLAYLAAGTIAILIMRMLGEMGSVLPASGSFSEYADVGIGHWAGFTQGWVYWLATVAVLGAEITGASAFVGAWFGVAPWIPALIFVVFFGAVNLLRVRAFGEFEFWFAFIKVAMLIAFLVIGVCLVLGIIPGTTTAGLELIRDEGFMPNGIGGVAGGLLAVAFAFGGIEVVAIAAAESDQPKKSLINAVRSTVTRISVFYLGSVLVIILLLPYSTLGAAKSAADSPFSKVLELAGIPSVVGFMEAIIVLKDAVIRELENIERGVIAHEAAHQAAAGRFGGPVSYTRTMGPDGKSYITGGQVPIRFVTGSTPEETLRNMEQIQKAALAPADPSGQDIRVAARAASAAAEARHEIARKRESEEGQEVPARTLQPQREDPSRTGAASILAVLRFQGLVASD